MEGTSQQKKIYTHRINLMN